MEKNDNIKRKLLSLKSHILRMPNTMKKVEILDGYMQLLCYYREICDLTEDEYNSFDISDDFLGKYTRYVTISTRKNLKELTKNAPFLYDMFSDIINTYHNEGFCSYEYNDFQKVNIDKMYDVIGDFFAFLGVDILNIYNKMIKNGNIYLLNNSSYAGVSMNSIAVDNPSIIIQNSEQYLEYYFTLAHEMGHCYQFYLQRHQPHYASFSPLAEVTSLLFEKMFADYLQKNHIIKSSFCYELQDHVYFLNDLAASKVLSKLFIEQNIGNINAFDLSYDTNSSLDSLLSLMASDCGYIMPNKLELGLDEFHYSLGNIIATYFMERIKNNFEKEWLNFKDFLCYVNYLPLDEILEKYTDVSLVKQKINDFMLNYRSQ